ncbi:uncharacterized protein LOC117318866 [Pecten maximus]|uniref:uncharacterized protein LOC117318866 n=1 Tax=Pecten maximus TaxID=6579 RepID=UPI001458C5EB|nr:uncharacterized protein LOC117318866 [Pecten maximus]
MKSFTRKQAVRKAPTTDWSSRNSAIGPRKQPSLSAKEKSSSYIDQFVANGNIHELLVHCDKLRMPLPSSPQRMAFTAQQSATLSFFLKYSERYSKEQEECSDELLKWYMENRAQLHLKHPPIAVMLASAVLMAVLKDDMELSSVYATLNNTPYQTDSKSATFKIPKHQFSVGSVTLNPSDMQTLLPGKWLNDQIIHAYLGLLNSNTTYVLPSFIAVHWEAGNFNWIYPQIPLHRYYQVLVPICHQHHWFLLVAEMRTGIVTVLDPLPNSQRADRFVGHWRKFMETRERVLKEAATRWTLGRNKSSRQDDGSSCGVFLLMNADAVVSQNPPTVMRQCHVMAYRKHIIDQLLKFAKPIRNNCDLLFCNSSGKQMFRCTKCNRMCHKACLGVCEGADVSTCILCV